jgi:death-on-curing protein
LELNTLSVEEVLRVHDALVRDFAQANDPISPPGVKSRDLLESAVSRQRTASGGRLKYPDPISNAATLLYGICCDHPFHNGNKRTALVSMLVHLDKNKLSPFETNQDELFAMIMQVAMHTIGIRIPPKRRERSVPRRNADEEVQDIAEWIAKRTARVVRGEKRITYRELRQILSRFNYSMENPDNNSIDIMKHMEEKKGFLLKKSTVITKRIGSIAYPGDTAEVSIKEIKKLRNMTDLTEENGVDSESFYDEAVMIDSFVNRYRTILRRLARR